MKILEKAEIKPIVTNLIESYRYGTLEKVEVPQLYGIGATKEVLMRIITLINDLIETFSDGIQFTDISYLFTHIDDIIVIGKNYKEAKFEVSELSHKEQIELINFLSTQLIHLIKPLQSASGNIYSIKNIDKFICQFKKLIQDGIKIFHDGMQVRDIPALLSLAMLMTEIAFNMKDVLNELKDLLRLWIVRINLILFCINLSG